MNADIIKALNNWRTEIVVSEDADLNDTIIQTRIASINKNADSSLAAFDKERQHSPLLTREVTTTTDMHAEFSSLLNVAVAWGSFGSKYYKDSGVLEVILYCLEWLNEHRYGRNEIEGHGWRNMRLFNWWHWEIGVPSCLEKTLVILGDKVTPEDCRRYLEVFDYRVPHARDYGSNKVEYGRLISGSGLLKRDPEQVFRGMKEIENTYEYADGGNNDWQGFYTDGSYIFHTRHPMNSTYGLAHFTGLIDLYKIYKGTCFEVPGLGKKLRYWATLTFLPFLHNGIVTKSVIGRHPTGGVSCGISMMRLCCELLNGADNEDYLRIASEIKANVIGGKIDEKSFRTFLSETARSEFDKMMKDDNVPTEYKNTCRAFYNEDRMIYRYGKTAFSLSMSSSRIYDYECINHENMTGWYGGDGMLTAFGSNPECYKNYWDNVSPYRYPGVTLDTRERIADTIAQANEYLSPQDYVGGLSDGTNGFASMNLESYHSDGELISKRFYNPDKSYGGPPIKRDCSLKAYKSWFFKKRSAVCMGCEINAHDDAEVITVVDSRKISEDTVIIHDSKSVWISDFGGYFLFNDADFKIEKELRNGFLFCNITVSHGVNPKKGSYRYVILPDISYEDLKQYCNSPEAEILSNDGNVQAVKFDNGTEEYAFREKCEFNGIKVSEPLLVMLKDNTICVADPTHKLESAEVNVKDKTYRFNLKNSYGKTISSIL